MAVNRSGILIVTYCSRDKDTSPGVMPAIDRYLSSRIRAAHEAARDLGTGFSILSGLHGLLRGDLEIAHYDHLLIPEQVPDHVRKLADQLQAEMVERVIFITRSNDVDPGTGPYRAAMRQACVRAKVGFEEVEFSQGEPTREDLVRLVGPLLA